MNTALIAVLIEYVVLFMVTIAAHEFGHYIVAKDQKIYKSFTMNPLFFSVNMTKTCKSRFDYAMGITMSFLTIPLWVYCGYSVYFVVPLLLAIGIVDILIIVIWNKPINLGFTKIEVIK